MEPSLPTLESVLPPVEFIEAKDRALKPSLRLVDLVLEIELDLRFWFGKARLDLLCFSLPR